MQPLIGLYGPVHLIRPSSKTPFKTPFKAPSKAQVLQGGLIRGSFTEKGALKGAFLNEPDLSGGKAYLWEGGIHGACYVWSPLIQNNQRVESELLMSITDWLPTLYEAAGNFLHKYSSFLMYCNFNESAKMVC